MIESFKEIYQTSNIFPCRLSTSQQVTRSHIASIAKKNSLSEAWVDYDAKVLNVYNYTSRRIVQIFEGKVESVEPNGRGFDIEFYDRADDENLHKIFVVKSGSCGCGNPLKRAKSLGKVLAEKVKRENKVTNKPVVTRSKKRVSDRVKKVSRS